MISKSTKAKRRRNAAFYALEKKIRVVEIERREGARFFLATLPLLPNYAVHLEATGERKAAQAYRSLLGYARRIQHLRPGVDLLPDPPRRVA